MRTRPFAFVLLFVAFLVLSACAEEQAGQKAAVDVKAAAAVKAAPAAAAVAGKPQAAPAAAAAAGKPQAVPAARQPRLRSIHLPLSRFRQAIVTSPRGVAIRLSIQYPSQLAVRQ